MPKVKNVLSEGGKLTDLVHIKQLSFFAAFVKKRYNLCLLTVHVLASISFLFRSSWDVRNLLEVFSREYTHKDFCLAHLFTDIKFEGGILGLAYVGSPRRNSVGGICTPEYFKNGYTLYLNSGLSSSR